MMHMQIIRVCKKVTIYIMARVQIVQVCVCVSCVCERRAFTVDQNEDAWQRMCCSQLTTFTLHASPLSNQRPINISCATHLHVCVCVTAPHDAL